MARSSGRWCLLVAVLIAFAGGARAGGARSFKSGPIQIAANGSTVWVVNPDHDSVSRIDTASEVVTEYPLPAAPERHVPRGLSVKEDGSEVWVACEGSDRLYVLRGADGAVLARIDLPWGSGPASVAFSRNQSQALVALRRGSIGSWYTHAPAQCAASTVPASGRRQFDLTPSAGNRYYVVTAYDVCLEGTAGTNSAGTPRPAANLTCSP